MSQGGRIRLVRQKAGMKQKAFGLLLGVEQSKVSKWELDKEIAPYSAIHRISKAFRVSEQWLRYGTDTMEPAPGSALAPIAKVDKHYCAGCFHYVKAGDENHCDFIGNVGHSRPCAAGKGCTERISPEDWAVNGKRIRAKFNEYIPKIHGRKKHAE